MRVFRVQHAIRGMGPYTANNCTEDEDCTGDEDCCPEILEICDILCDVHFDPENRPSPIDDGLRPLFDWNLCGGPSIDWLAEWFANFGKSLVDDGFIVLECEVPAIWMEQGRSGQIVFSQDHATVVTTHQITWE